MQQRMVRWTWMSAAACFFAAFATSAKRTLCPAPWANCWLTAATVLCLVVPVPAQGPIVLRDVTEETGIGFRHTDGSSGERYIVESVASGLALLDYDGDGRTDIYFLNGAPLGGHKLDHPAKNCLYRNEGNWTFTEVTDKAAVGDTGFGLGVTAGDYDNDGDLDLYVSNYGPNVLYRNDGDGTFTDVTATAGVGNGARVGAGACFLDADGDGDLDLYVANYVQFSYANHGVETVNGYPMYASPRRYRPEPDTLYRNNGDGTFRDISSPSGVGGVAGYGMGVVCLDYDNDGDTDVFVCNDTSENFLFQNDGEGRFEEVGLLAGVSRDGNGRVNGSMGADCGDYDNDGMLDLFMTDYQGERPILYRNLAHGFFDDVTVGSGVGAESLAQVTWGSGLVDFDNDGDRDIFMARGHLQDNIDRYDNTTSYCARNILLMNKGDGTFINVSDQCGDGMLVKLSSRGTGFDDLDNDGDIDVVILNSRQRPTILRNDTDGGNHWLQIRLRGTRTNRDGVGARVKVVAGGLSQVDEVHSGRGFQSHHGMRLQFGLGRREKVDRIEVHWIGAGTDVVEHVAADQLIDITESATPVSREAKP